MSVKVIAGDIVETDCQAIVQQCNCLTIKSHGLSKYIGSKLGVQVYNRRKGRNNLADPEFRSQTGTIEVSMVKETKFETHPEYVVNFYSQYSCGKPGRWFKNLAKAREETAEMRENWFYQCLLELEKWIKNENITSVAFPHCIGCGLAGGDWDKYLDMILDFSKRVNGDTNKVEVLIVKFS